MHRRTARTLSALGCTVALALGAAACGGDDEEPKKKATPTIDAVTQEFRDEAQKICTTAVTELRKKIGTTSEDQSDAELKAAFVTVGQGFLDEIADLRALEPSPADEAAVDAWLDEFEKAAKKVKANGLAIVRKGQLAFTAADGMAVNLSLPQCATDAS